MSIHTLSPTTINTVVLSHGKDNCGLPEDMVDYILQVNRAYELFTDPKGSGSMVDAARRLQLEYPRLSISTARRRVADSVAMMHTNTDNTPENWLEFYADKMDRLGKQCEDNGEMEAARRAYERAMEYRLKATEGRVDPRLTEYKPLLVSPDVQADRLGLDKMGVRELLARSRLMIEKTSLAQKDKERLIEDLELEMGESN